MNIMNKISEAFDNVFAPPKLVNDVEITLHPVIGKHVNEFLTKVLEKIPSVIEEDSETEMTESSDERKLKIFNTVYDLTSVEVDFDESWLKESNIYVNLTILFTDEIVKSIDPSGRRILIANTILGTVSIYEKFPDEEFDGVFLYTTTGSKFLSKLITSKNEITLKDMHYVLKGGLFEDLKDQD